MTASSAQSQSYASAEQRFGGRTAIITGAGSGIGAATARLLAAEGAKVVVTDVDDARGEAVAASLSPGSAVYARLDVSSDDDWAAASKAAVGRFGGIDILVNNAGTGVFGQVPDISTDDWLRVMSITLHSVFRGCREVIPQMRRRGGGAIVNIASISGLAGDYGTSSYNTAKAGVLNLTRNLAIDHAPDNIRVNALCPGLVETAATQLARDLPGLWDAYVAGIPMKRAAQPDEMARVAAFLASDDASYITGTILVADGGKTAHTGQPNFGDFLK